MRRGRVHSLGLRALGKLLSTPVPQVRMAAEQATMLARMQQAVAAAEVGHSLLAAPWRWLC